jgi:hypothetical protein
MKLSYFFIWIVILSISVLTIACTQERSTPTESYQAHSSPTPGSSLLKPLPTTTPPTHANPSTQIINNNIFGLTYQQPNGNRIIPGAGISLPPTPIDIKLPGIPGWVVGTAFEEGIIWTVALEDGSVINMIGSGQNIRDYPVSTTTISPGAPINTLVSDQHHSIISVPDPNQSQSTHPVYLPKSKSKAYLTENGDLNVVNSSGQLLASLQINALPDSRIILDDRDRILILSDPTEIYNHGVLGDRLEARTITLIETFQMIQVASIITLEENEVIEGIAPIWVDMTGNGDREIVVTVSDLDLGAGIVVFSETGERLAMGPKMGQPFRWRHQIAFAATGPGGENELIVVRTPHIGGVIEFYRVENGELKVAAEYTGITSHVIGSRNLDMAAAVDLDGDKPFEVLLPSPNLEELVAVRRSEFGAEEIWTLPIGGQLSTNIAGAEFSNGQIALAVGNTDGVLRIWMPNN